MLNYKLLILSLSFRMTSAPANYRPCNLYMQIHTRNQRFAVEFQPSEKYQQHLEDNVRTV